MDKNPPRSLFALMFHTALLILGTVVALRFAVCYVQPILPWIVGGLAVGALVWVVVAVARWHRNQW